MTWNTDKTRKHKLLRQELDALDQQRADAVHAALQKLAVLGFSREATENLIAYADDVRDALEPFDSGERMPMCAPGNTPPV